MDEIDLHNMMEAADFGGWLIEAIAEKVGAPPKPDMIDDVVFRNTDNGVWVRFDEHGILVGSVVPEKDKEFTERVDVSGLMDLDDAIARSTLFGRFKEAVRKVDGLAEECRAETLKLHPPKSM
jgi:hypothetical protein